MVKSWSTASPSIDDKTCNRSLSFSLYNSDKLSIRYKLEKLFVNERILYSSKKTYSDQKESSGMNSFRSSGWQIRPWVLYSDIACSSHTLSVMSGAFSMHFVFMRSMTVFCISFFTDGFEIFLLLIFIFSFLIFFLFLV